MWKLKNKATDMPLSIKETTFLNFCKSRIEFWVLKASLQSAGDSFTLTHSHRHWIACHNLEVMIIFTETCWSVEKAGQMAEASSLACSASYQAALPEQYQPPSHMTNYQVCALGWWWKWCRRWMEGWSSCYWRKIDFPWLAVLIILFLYLSGETERS